ncbi:MAG: FtsW/RodA/SpoVE family cell cycle protein [Clostridia bacterium]|nr:FtsW/RodA/SpoVE family cell cycle protein [Clostridia bacterium]
MAKRRERDDTDRRKKQEKMLVYVEMIFFFSAFLLLTLKEGWDWTGFLLAVLIPVIIYVTTVWLAGWLRADKLLMAIVNFLCALGVLMLHTTDRIAGFSRGIQQLGHYGLGLVVMFCCILFVRIIRRWKWPVRILLALSVILIILPVLIGKEINGAQNWIFIGGFSLQPSEIVKVSLGIILSYYMSERRFWTWFVFLAICMGALMLQRDLGTALVYFTASLILFYAHSGNVLLTLAGLAGASGAAVFGYHAFRHVQNRVAAWKNPWSDYHNTGYQLAQTLIAIASAGLTGVGLGLGSPCDIPYYFTDFIFAIICEQFGLLFGIFTMVLYAIIILRGMSIAIHTRYSFYGLLAMAVTALLGMQTFIIIGGVLKLIPLTGITLPFVSYGGTSMLSCMALIGLLQGVSSINQDEMKYDSQISCAEEAQPAV